MKFAVASALALANGIVAMPWSSQSSKQSAHKAISAEEDITLHIKVSQGTGTPKQEHSIYTSVFDICLRVCWPEIPTCPTGWYSNNLGTADNPCWTCCKAPEDL